MPALPSRTHVPRADDTSTEQALAPRAGARCRWNGTRVRDAGRGNARPHRGEGPGSPAGPPTLRAAGRPHRRPPAPPTAHTSATRAAERQRPPTRAGLPHAGLPPGGKAGLIRRRRPVWEDGSAGRPGVLPGAPDFIASRAAPRGAVRVPRGRAGSPAVSRRPGRAAGAPAARAGPGGGAPAQALARPPRRRRARPGGGAPARSHGRDRAGSAGGGRQRRSARASRASDPH